jgi:uncharacterized membrane protein
MFSQATNWLIDARNDHTRDDIEPPDWRKMHPEKNPRKIWILPVAVVTAIAIFGATFFVYAEDARTHRPGGWMPMVIGIGLFTAIMAFLTDVYVTTEERRRGGLTIAIVIGEVAVFFYAIMFLILNIFGS